MHYSAMHHAPRAAYALGVGRTLRIAIYFPSYGSGGAERMLINLANGLVAVGMDVDFIAGNPRGPYIANLAQGVKLFSSTAVGKPAYLEEYLLTRSPTLVLAAKENALAQVLATRKKIGKSFKVVARPGTNFSKRLADRNFLKRHLEYRRLTSLYNEVDLIVANSCGVAADVSELTGIDRARIPVIYNPVITPALTSAAEASCFHPWLQEGNPLPTIVGMGRLSRVKGFDVLLRAVASVTFPSTIRLVILGEGRLKPRLRVMAERLGIGSQVDFPGFVPDPYACLSRADLFVRSSRREGSPNALTEALALGIPVVATDCPSGPREILQDGRYGNLVPVDDAGAMARAIATELSKIHDRSALKASVAKYSQSHCASEYSQLLQALVDGDTVGK